MRSFSTTGPHLSPLPSDFNGAIIDTVTVGPRRELVLIVSPMVWEGQQARHVDPVSVRFGGVKNLEEVSAFFATAPHRLSELGCLRYAEQPTSKPGHLFLDLAFERTEARIVVNCSSLQIGPTGANLDSSHSQ